ncbi:MAG: imidazole glycerol phosphate synthase subunit HisH [Planctomycetaceae bacterium]
MNRVAVIDYGRCNLDSIARAVEECGGAPRLARAPADLEGTDRVILPGVGSFRDAMERLRERRLDEALTERVLPGRVPFLGICLGMQLLASEGSEGGASPGLGWIAGKVRRLTPADRAERVPHVGWNEVLPRADAPLFQGIAPATDFYFVHSFALQCADETCITARTPYCGGFVSSVSRGDIHGVQFHPEKSLRPGFALLRNFLAL